MKLRRLILPLFLLAFAINAHATTVDLQFVGVGPGFNDGTYYVYPYQFSINGSQALLAALCDDFQDHIAFGETWQANVYSFSDILLGNSPTTDPLIGQMDPLGGLVADGQKLAAYKDAAWLYQQLTDDVTPGNAVAINHTIWGLFSSTPYNSDTDVQGWYADAQLATSGLSNADAANMFSNVVFYTPVNGSQVPFDEGRPQELIGTGSAPKTAQSVPEPSSLMLLGSGLLGLAVVRRKALCA